MSDIQKLYDFMKKMKEKNNLDLVVCFSYQKTEDGESMFMFDAMNSCISKDSGIMIGGGESEHKEGGINFKTMLKAYIHNVESYFEEWENQDYMVDKETIGKYDFSEESIINALYGIREK